MSITSAEILFWFFSTMLQPLRTMFSSWSARPISIKIAAAADALQNVLDVVRERGDRLPDGRQPFGLHHRRVVGGVFDRQRRLMADGDHQLQMLFVKLAAGRWQSPAAPA